MNINEAKVDQSFVIGSCFLTGWKSQSELGINVETFTCIFKIKNVKCESQRCQFELCNGQTIQHLTSEPSVTIQKITE